jgi:hypothetical protein
MDADTGRGMWYLAETALAVWIIYMDANLVVVPGHAA